MTNLQKRIEIVSAYIRNQTPTNWAILVRKVKELDEEESGSFPITSVSREDFKNEGWDTSTLTDDDMREVASKMADSFCDGDYWVTLDVIASDILKLKQI